MERFIVFVVAAACLLYPARAQQMGGSLVPTPTGNSQIGAAMLEGTGAPGATSLADRVTEVGRVFDLSTDFLAKCDGTTDDSVALNKALSTLGNYGGLAVVPVGRFCRAAATITVPPGVTLDLGGFGPGYPVVGGGIICDAGVSPCVILGSYASNGTTALRNGTITRAGAPSAGTIGIEIYGYHNTINNVLSDNSAKCWAFNSDIPAGAGIHTEIYGGSAQRCSDVFADFNGYPEVYWFGGRFGINGGNDYASNAYVRTEGGLAGSAGGPNTIQFYGVQFTSGGAAATHFWEFVNLATGGVPSIDATDFRIIGGHIENLATAANGGAVFYSDSTWNAIDRMSVQDLAIDAPSTPMFALNPGTAVDEWDINSVLMYVSGLSLAPTNGFNSFHINGGRVTGAMHLTGASGSTASITNLDHGAAYTLDGAWGQYNAFGETYSNGSLTNNATGNVTVDNAQNGRNALEINPTSGAANAFLVPANGIASIYFEGNTNINDVSWQLSSSGGFGGGSSLSILDGYNSYTQALKLNEGGNIALGELSENVHTFNGYPKLQGVTVANLAACNTAAAGEIAYVTNGASSPTYNATVSSTGSSNDLVFCNGSNWTYH